MCVGRRPKPPKLPDPEPVDSAIEETTDRVVIGSNRSDPEMKRRRKLSTTTGRRRLGTQSLQIPLLVNSLASGNLNYS
tara:strand:+ start:286 stop:519 length:234 start_codon:yes stop_codon:yes gene_type:complete